VAKEDNKRNPRRDCTALYCALPGTPTSEQPVGPTFKVNTLETAARLAKGQGAEAGMYNGLPIEVRVRGVGPCAWHEQEFGVGWPMLLHVLTFLMNRHAAFCPLCPLLS